MEPYTVLLYVTHLHQCGLAHSTISVYLSAVRSLHVLAGLPEPQLRTPQVNLALRAIKAHTPAPKQKDPITVEVLCKMLQITDTESEALLWRAALCLAFFAGLRGSEYLPSGDKESQPLIRRLRFSKEGTEPLLHYSVPQSKTTTHGFTIPLGCTGKKLCPYCAMVKYLELRQNLGTLNKSAPLFLAQSGKCITKSIMNQKLRQLGCSLGMHGANLSTHSLRAGAATTAAELGFSDWEIMKLGGWRSATYRAYIRKLDHHRAQFPARLAAAAPAPFSSTSG